jgi:hypothetical protein
MMIPNSSDATVFNHLDMDLIVNCSAFIRAMNAPDIAKIMLDQNPIPKIKKTQLKGNSLEFIYNDLLAICGVKAIVLGYGKYLITGSSHTD